MIRFHLHNNTLSSSFYWFITGVFLVVYNKIDNTVETFDGREVAPLAATNNVYKKASFTFGKFQNGSAI